MSKANANLTHEYYFYRLKLWSPDLKEVFSEHQLHFGLKRLLSEYALAIIS